MVRVGIIGASGFTGAELLRLCAAHPEVEVVCATGDSQAGTLASVLYPSLAAAYPNLVFEEFSADRFAGLDAVFLGVPHEAALEMAPQLVGKVGVVIDLSAAYRLKDSSLYPTWYGFEHTPPHHTAHTTLHTTQTHPKVGHWPLYGPGASVTTPRGHLPSFCS
jgi:N-acetyl-gamma-glutamylphosphate reductase